jgi:hypothetical protein
MGGRVRESTVVLPVNSSLVAPAIGLTFMEEGKVP